MKLEDYLSQQGQSEADYMAEVRKAAENRVIGSIVMQKLTDELEIEVDEEAVEKQLAEMRHVYKKDENALKQLDNPEVINGIRNQMRINMTLDKLVELNKPHAKKVKASGAKKPAAKKSAPKKK